MKVNYMNKGFSMVELMVVIAILAILIAVAIPAYRTYVLKARLIAVSQVLNSYLNLAKEAYLSSNTIPAAIKELTTATATAESIYPHIDYIYYDDGSAWANAGKAAMVQAIVAADVGHAISGYSSGSSGDNNRLTMAFVVVNGSIQTYCGNWQDGSEDIPEDYLPVGCSDDNFITDVTG